MTAKEQIGRLQDLLERVQLRAQQARGNGVAAFAAPVAAYAEAPAETYAEATPSPAPVEVDHDSFPPATHAEAAGEAAAETYSGDSGDEDGDVEVSSEVVEVDIDVDEPIAMESGAQPVAQQTMPPEELEEIDDPLALTDHVSVRPERPSLPRPTPDEEITQAFVAPTPAANEIEEPAPSSSRRPIAGEEATENYGAESAPRHTPPPESGKQVAAPSVHPAASASAPPVRAASEPSISVGSLSAPPPSLEGHTLIGGWREPGLGGPQIGPPGGAGPAGPGIPTPMAQPAAQVAPAQVSGTRLTPDITRPEIAATATVARIESPAPIARPATMGDLLDLTLAL